MLHRAQRTHAAVHLVGTALIDFGRAGGLVRAREHTAEHDAGAARSQRLHDVAGILDAAVSNDADAVLVGLFRAVRHRRHLRHADACHNTGRADRARPNADLHAVNSRGDQVMGCRRRRHIAREQLNIREALADGFHLTQHADGMAMRRIDGNHVHLRVQQRFDAIEHIVRHADRRAAEQTTLGVLGGIRVLRGLFNVLDGNQTAQHTVFIHNRQLLDAVLRQNLLRLLKRRADGRGDEVFAGHDFADFAAVIRFKAKVAVGQDADKFAVAGNRHAADAIARHQVFRVLNQVIGREEEGVGDNAVLRALHLINLRCLFCNGHVLVDDAQTAFARHCNGHAGIRYRVHCGRHQRNVQLNHRGELNRKIDFLGQHFTAGRNQQHIIERKTFPNNLLQHGRKSSS